MSHIITLYNSQPTLNMLLMGQEEAPSIDCELVFFSFLSLFETSTMKRFLTSPSLAPRLSNILSRDAYDTLNRLRVDLNTSNFTSSVALYSNLRNQSTPITNILSQNEYRSLLLLLMQRWTEGGLKLSDRVLWSSTFNNLSSDFQLMLSRKRPDSLLEDNVNHLVYPINLD